MKRTLLVLALALFGFAGCRAVQTGCGQACGSPCCGSCCDSCHMSTMKHAPRPECCSDCCAEGCGRGGNMETDCPGGNCCVFDRYHGSDCGPGYPCGEY